MAERLEPGEDAVVLEVAQFRGRTFLFDWWDPVPAPNEPGRIRVWPVVIERQPAGPIPQTKAAAPPLFFRPTVPAAPEPHHGRDGWTRRDAGPRDDLSDEEKQWILARVGDHARDRTWERPDIMWNAED